MPKISLTNSKLGAAIPSVNLPAVVTCRANAPCTKGCYALKGNWCYKNVKLSLQRNLEEYLNNPDYYFESIKTQLNNPLLTYKYFRFHSSGDVIDDNYFSRMVELSRQLTNINFLAFTKKFEIVNKYVDENGDLPPNLKIVFSAWDKNFKIENPHNFPVTYVNFKDKEKNPEIPPTAIPCTGKCYKCLACWSLHKGQSVVFKQH